MPTPTNSLLISTYNNPAALELVLLSLAGQRIKPMQAVIADDGSTDETRNLINDFKGRLSIPLIHVWHPDDGFRAAAIRNKAIASCAGDFIIQIDGDIIMHPRFVQDHLTHATPGFFNVGSRVLLNQDKTEALQRDKKWIVSLFSKGVRNHINAMRIPIFTSLLYKPKADASGIIEEVRGCNMSFWRDDMIRVNGYNEDFVGWGREDSELGVRLVLAGVKKRQLKFSAIQYHQHHPINSRSRYDENDALLNSIVKEGNYRCKNGLNNHL